METGVIYRISWPSGEYYIGSTTKTIQKRLSAHKTMSKYWSSKFYNFAREQGWEHATIEIVQHNVPIASLFDLERLYIIQGDAKDGTAILNTVSVYKKTPQEMMDERRKRDREYSRAYYERNKEIILAKRQKSYNQNNNQNNNLTPTTNGTTETS
jgi:hypothetical protein